MNESEIRELLKFFKGIEHYIERCLKTEQEKNEARVKRQLENSGVEILDNEETNDYCPTCGRSTDKLVDPAEGFTF